MPKIQIDQGIIEDIISYHDCDHAKRDDSCVNCALKSQYEQETGKHSDDIMRAPGVGPAHLRKEGKINPTRELKKVALELEAADGIKILEQGKVLDVPAEDISRIDSAGVKYKHPEGWLVGASWNLMFIHEAMNFMSEDEFVELCGFTELPEGEYDWSFIRDAGPTEKQDMVNYVKGLPAFKKMQELGLTSVSKV